MTNDSKSSKGFAGLDDMTSKVDLPDPILRPSVTAVPPLGQQTKSSNTQSFEVDESLLAASKSPGMSLQKKWAIGIGIFVVLVVIANLSGKNSSGTHSAPVAYEEMPAPGIGVVFSENQIRYCLAQDIRLASWGSAVDHYSQTSIDSFNSAVRDYNSRCSNYKYRRGALERVRSDVESRRSIYQSEGSSNAAIYR